MNSSIHSNTKFRAHFISNGNVKKNSLLKNSYKEAVSFVELDKNSYCDIKAILKLNKKWKDSLLEDIIYHLTTFWGKKSSIYFLTTQKNNFARLNTNKILGTVTIYPEEENRYCIDFLQVNPKHINNKQNKSKAYNVFQPQYEYCGSEILNCLKRLFPQKDLETIPISNTIDFYKKNGFVPKGQNSNRYIYKAPDA